MVGDVIITNTQLHEIEFFRDGVELMLTLGAFTPEQADELTGFGLMPGSHKEQLLGIPFMILEFEFRAGNEGTEFVEMTLITTTEQKLKMRDSSRGIFRQLQQLYKERVSIGHPTPTMGVYVRKGLSYQDHPYTDPLSNITTNSRTYFLTT